MDSDDTIEEGCFQSIVDSFEEDVDLLQGKTAINKENMEKDADEYITGDLKEKIINDNDVIKILRCALLQGETKKDFGIRAEIWGKAFRREIVNDVRLHPDLVIGEDQVFLAEYLMKCRGVKLVNQIWYHYYVHSESAMRKLDYKKEEKYINYFYKLREILIKHFRNLESVTEILAEKAYLTLSELVYSYELEKITDKEIAKNAFASYRKLKNNKVIKFYLKKIPLKSSRIGYKGVICSRLCMSVLGIKLFLVLIKLMIKNQ